MSKVMLYDPISAPVFSNHDLLFITYDHHINMQQEEYEYRGFKGIDCNLLLRQLEDTYWNQIYSYNDVNDQMRFVQENVKFLYEANVPKRTRQRIKLLGLPFILGN